MMSLSVVCKAIDPDHVISTTLPSAAEAEERRMRGGLYGIDMIIIVTLAPCPLRSRVLSLRSLPSLHDFRILDSTFALQRMNSRVNSSLALLRVPAHSSTPTVQYLKDMFPLQFAHWSFVFEMYILGCSLLLNSLWSLGRADMDV